MIDRERSSYRRTYQCLALTGGLIALGGVSAYLGRSAGPEIKAVTADTSARTKKTATVESLPAVDRGPKLVVPLATSASTLDGGRDFGDQEIPYSTLSENELLKLAIDGDDAALLWFHRKVEDTPAQEIASTIRRAYRIKFLRDLIHEPTDESGGCSVSFTAPGGEAKTETRTRDQCRWESIFEALKRQSEENPFSPHFLAALKMTKDELRDFVTEVVTYFAKYDPYYEDYRNDVDNLMRAYGIDNR